MNQPTTENRDPENTSSLRSGTSDRTLFDPVSVIIPAYNEADAIAGQIEAVHKVLNQHSDSDEIIVIDDGSTDQTLQIVRNIGITVPPGVRLLRHYENRGYGAALKTGILAAKNEYIVILDADNTYPADQIPALLNKLHTSDMVVGARLGETVHVPLARKPAKWFLRFLATRIASKPIPDLNSGMRAFRRGYALQYLPILSNRFSFTTTITLAYLADDYRIVYLPINYYPRIGKSKIVPRHFIDFLMLILRMSMMFDPLRVYLPLALLFGGTGLAKSIYDMIAVFIRSSDPGLSLLLEPVLSTSAVLLLFISLQFLMIGMVADGVIRRIIQSNRPLKPSSAVESVSIEAKPHV